LGRRFEYGITANANTDDKMKENRKASLTPGHFENAGHLEMWIAISTAAAFPARSECELLHKL
jgi:hypothetical protein